LLFLPYLLRTWLTAMRERFQANMLVVVHLDVQLQIS